VPAVEHRDDSGMPKRDEEIELALESKPLRFRGEHARTKEFHRDRTPRGSLHAMEDDALPALAEYADELVSRDRRRRGADRVERRRTEPFPDRLSQFVEEPFVEAKGLDRGAARATCIHVRLYPFGRVTRRHEPQELLVRRT